VDTLAAAIEQPIDILITAAAIVDLSDYQGNGTATATMSHNRRTADNSHQRSKTKVQGTFELNVPGGEDCTLDITSSTSIYDPCDRVGDQTDPDEWTQAQTYRIYADDDSVQQRYW
jgi:hypothetical protein